MVQQIENRRYRDYYWAKKAKTDESEFAVYKDDELICMGTAKECADYLGIKVSSFFMYMAPSRIKQIGATKKGKRSGMEIIRLDDEEDDE